uniref:Uncharacterized protein n=1 Tax=Anguilla anguilla TaxID=7936 RepID=A0A0E9PDE5_ANGAN
MAFTVKTDYSFKFLAGTSTTLTNGPQILI